MKTIRIKDYYGIYQEIPVSDELYEEWRALQNETQRVHRKGSISPQLDTNRRSFRNAEALMTQNPMEDTSAVG